MSSSYRRQLSKAVRERRTTYHEFVCHLIQLIRDDNDPVRRVDIDEEFLNSLEPAEEMGAITETETTVFQMIVNTKTEDDWWANVAKHKFGLSHEVSTLSRSLPPYAMLCYVVLEDMCIENSTLC